VADYEITITFDGTYFVYTDERGHACPTKAHANGGDTIRWKLVAYPHSHSLSIDFNINGNPFTPPTTTFVANTGNFTNRGTFNGSHNKSYSYSVTAKDAGG